MNVYEMYQANGNKAGFWIRRDNWGRIVAKVLKVGGKERGALPGKAPYFGNPAVLAVFVESASGQVKDQSQVSCPGTGAYRLAEQPAAYSE